MNELLKLLSRYEIESNTKDLIPVLTHNSFSEKNNSRYVFLGQFAYRGIVATWVFENIAGTGTQLQHYLGNLLSQKRLESYYEKWKISKVRIASTAQIDQQKHIFVYAVLGYIVENASEEQLQEFVFNQFIASADHLLPSVYKHKNEWDKLVFLCKQEFNQKPKLITTISDDKTNKIEVFLNDEVIGLASSISFKYAKKKAITAALKHITIEIEKKLTKSPVYIENEKIRKENLEVEKLQVKQVRQEKHLLRNKTHQEKMAVRRQLIEKEAQELDRKRKEVKQKLKEKASKKGVNTIYREYTAEEIAAMSVSKRRNLQDKGIISKGIN
ncbi:hypothetical protein [Flavobacterium sp.]|uniref:hypothetical protein n=1 Tax=Flavobacterium sp. TaxID=239 RepID=UPI00286E62A0|nr:hypothetical protein [Flavobacterium sp.]